MSFKNKIAIVTGAAMGIGLETALQLARDGARVVLVDVQWTESRKAMILEAGQAVFYNCDVSDEEKVNQVVKDVIDKYGRVDILINNAGIWRDNWSDFAASDSNMWRQKINVNILGTMYFTRAVINNMIENHYGRIINIASVAGVYGIRKMVDYSMTKGAVIAFTIALAKEVGPYGITVNAVSPGNIRSDPSSKDNPDLSFLNRSGSNEECANVITFLASDKASYVSGQNYIVDGSRKKM